LADQIDVVARGKDTDIATLYLFNSLATAPGISVLAGMHFDSLGLRAVRTDASGRILVNGSTTTFGIIDVLLTDNFQSIVSGSPIFRRVIFYAFNANASVRFQLVDLTLTGIITLVPNVPLTIEGVFVAIQAANGNPGIPAKLEVIIGSDPTLGA